MQDYSIKDMKFSAICYFSLILHW